MNWVFFGIHTGVVIACILYLILKKPKQLIFVLLSLFFLAANLIIIILGRIKVKWINPSGEWDQINTIQDVISYLDMFSILVLMAMTLFFIIRYIKKNGKTSRKAKKITFNRHDLQDDF